MGIVNVTPDSFSDGGRFVDPDRRVVDTARAVEAGRALVEAGADLLDVGGESTRPGYEPVAVEVQIARVVPVIEGLRAIGITVPISIDTTRAEVAEAALEAGGDWINDTSAFDEDPDLRDVAVRFGCPVVLMHRFDPPRPLAAPDDPRVAHTIAAGLEGVVAGALKAGIQPERIVLDPGIGFGTSHRDSLRLHHDLAPLRLGRYPLLIGASRKRFLGWAAGHDRPAAARDDATAASSAVLAVRGVEILRVHNVGAMRDVVRVADALAAPRPPDPAVPNQSPPG